MPPSQPVRKPAAKTEPAVELVSGSRWGQQFCLVENLGSHRLFCPVLPPRVLLAQSAWPDPPHIVPVSQTIFVCGLSRY